jgi:hypothetical protein
VKFILLFFLLYAVALSLALGKRGMRSALGIEHPQLQVVRGNVLDYSSVEAAVRGHDAVLCALGHTQFFDPTRILSEGTRNLLRAMEAHNHGRHVGSLLWTVRISRADVAEFMLNQLTDDSYLETAPGVCG